MERRHKHLELDLALINELARPVFGTRAVVAAEPLTGGMINTNYKLRLSGSDEAFVLRLYARDPAACAKELAIWRLAHERVPLPEILHAEPQPDQIATPYAITRWIDGMMLREVLAHGDRSEQQAAVRAAGATLTTLGTFRFAANGFFDADLGVPQPFPHHRDSTVGYIERCLFAGYAGDRLGSDRGARLWAWVQDQAALLDRVPEQATLVHCDYQPTNLLMRRASDGWQVAAVLDWEWALANTPLLDVAIMRRNLDQLGGALAHDFVTSFVAHGGTLPDGWQTITRLLDLINLCEFLNTATPRPMHDAHVIDLIDGTIAGR